MRFLSPDTDLSGIAPAASPDSSQVPTDMETDPTNDREIIDQQTGDTYPKEADQSAETTVLENNNLSEAIAYALDGSGPGMTHDTPNAPGGHQIITRGTTNDVGDFEEE